MKTLKFLKFTLVLIASVAITSCVQDDDYSVPSSLGQEENLKLEDLLASATEVSIAEVKAMYNPDPNNDGDTDDAMPFEVDTDIYVKGYVSSSDRTGNFFKEFYLQDSPTNPTGALKVTLNQVDSYNKYNFGREVYIKLKGLFIGEERVANGVITIGGKGETDQYGTTVESLNENEIKNHLLRSTVTEEMTPLVVTFSGISNSHVGLLVSVENVEFAEDLAGKRYFDPNEVYDTKRTMQDCNGFEYNEFPLETSGFSSFKNEPLPTGNGSITAVVSKTFDGASLVLALNSTDDVNMTGERCTLMDINDFSVVFDEDFSNGQGSWEVTNTLGTKDWYASSYNGNGYMRGSAFQNNNIVEMISWLISPSIDFDAQENEQLILKIADAFNNGQPLKAYYSNDYTTGSNPDNATWTEIGTNQIEALPVNNGYFDNLYQATGFIDLSMVTGNAVLAFVYDSNNSTVSTTIDLSNVQILAQ